MNNNQDNFNNIPQMNNNPNEQLNVIPQPIQNNNINNMNDANQNTFIQSPINTQLENNAFEEVNPLLNQQHNKFLNNGVNGNNASLNNLNVDGEYHNLPKIDYSKDPRVQENLKKRNTVTITGEGKVFLLIILVLLAFIIALPYIFDAISNIGR